MSDSEDEALALMATTASEASVAVGEQHLSFSVGGRGEKLFGLNACRKSDSSTKKGFKRQRKRV